MEVDDLIEVVRDCARQIHGDKACVSVEEMPASYPPDHRFRASVKVRGVVVDSRHAATHSESARQLARDLASRSRSTLNAQAGVDFRASVLGLV